MAALALISELATQSQATAAATRSAAVLKTVASELALLAEAEQNPPGLVILDLSHPGLSAAELVPRLKALLGSQVTIVAFGPHVHHERLEAARQAGCDVVISRGQFHAQIDQILAQYAR